MFENTKDFFRKARGQISSIAEKVRFFIEDSKKKFHNLYQTNYDTGMYHLSHGNLWDAAFRFKIIKRFWPNKLEAQYMYAYCLVLQNLNFDAKKLLNEILEKDPNYLEAKDLLEKIEKNETAKVIDEFKVKFNLKDDVVENKNIENEETRNEDVENEEMTDEDIKDEETTSENKENNK